MGRQHGLENRNAVQLLLPHHCPQTVVARDELTFYRRGLQHFGAVAE